MSGPAVVQVRREGGAADVLFLCQHCETTVDDFLRVTRRGAVHPTNCDRCERHTGDTLPQAQATSDT